MIEPVLRGIIRVYAHNDKSAAYWKWEIGYDPEREYVSGAGVALGTITPADFLPEDKKPNNAPARRDYMKGPHAERVMVRFPSFTSGHVLQQRRLYEAYRDACAGDLRRLKGLFIQKFQVALNITYADNLHWKSDVFEASLELGGEAVGMHVFSATPVQSLLIR